uniref:Secreted protein n=1 Tax=Ananas comosus var. bracteatus TaxID=296719 RepID=A0A6V7NFG3_ANACO|nr:unnamed protein product [Ananas comosus var. bracteatus]
MPHRTRPMTSLLLFMGLNLVLVNTVSPVYDFVCFLPYWERRNGELNNLQKWKLGGYVNQVYFVHFSLHHWGCLVIRMRSRELEPYAKSQPRGTVSWLRAA